MYRLKTAFLLLFVVLSLLSCGGGGAGDQPSDKATATSPSGGQTYGGATAPTPAQEATEPAVVSGEQDLNLSSLTGGLAGLDSYKSKFTMTFSGKDEQGQPVSGTWTMEEDLTREPLAQRTTMSSTSQLEGEAGQFGSFEVITIGDMSYWIAKEADGVQSCSSMSSGEATNPQEGIFTPDMIGEISDAKYLGTDTVNEVRAKHYAWEENSLPVWGFSGVKGDVWMATDGEYVVKYVAEASGKGMLFGSSQEEGTIRFGYDLTDVNGAFTIEPPAECEVPATDIPIMADAEDKMSFGTTVSYSSPSALADVVAFYQGEMPGNGWQASGEPMAAEGFASLEFTKDGRTAGLMLTYDADAQKTGVLITVTPAQ
jgi:hypothetical protein